MNAPAIAGTHPDGLPIPPKPAWMSSSLVIDPPRATGVQVGDVVECWPGEVPPPYPVCGIVSGVGNGNRVDIHTFVPGLISNPPHSGAILWTDQEYVGKMPGVYRYRPASATKKVQALGERCMLLETKVKELSDQIEFLMPK